MTTTMATVEDFQRRDMTTGYESDGSDVSCNSSDTSERFNLRKYEKDEENAMYNFRMTYQQELCDRYLHTIHLRKMKAIQRNLLVLEHMNAAPAKEEKKEVDENRDVKTTPPPKIVWKPLSVNHTLMVVVPQVDSVVEEVCTQSSNHRFISRNQTVASSGVQQTRKSLLRDRFMSKQQPAKHITVAKEKCEKDVSDEEMVRAFTNSAKSSPATSKPPSARATQPPVQPASKSDMENQPVAHVRTRMCRFGRNCHRSKCTFAHTLAEFTPMVCRFRECKNGNSCRYFHQSKETKEQFLRRSCESNM